MTNGSRVSAESWPQKIAALPRLSYADNAFRHQSPGFDPLSGEGARLHGGRFTPPGSFATLYLAPRVTTVAAELSRFGERQAIGVESLLPRELYFYSLNLRNVYDLTTEESAEKLSIARSDLTSDDLTATRLIGEAAFSLGASALISYSAADPGLIIAVFPENLNGANLEPELLETWERIEQIPGG